MYRRRRRRIHTFIYHWTQLLFCIFIDNGQQTPMFCSVRMQPLFYSGNVAQSRLYSAAKYCEISLHASMFAILAREQKKKQIENKRSNFLIGVFSSHSWKLSFQFQCCDAAHIQFKFDCCFLSRWECRGV